MKLFQECQGLATLAVVVSDGAFHLRFCPPTQRISLVDRWRQVGDELAFGRGPENVQVFKALWSSVMSP